MRITITVGFRINDFVVLKTDPEVKRQITGLLIREKSHITYLVKKGEDEIGYCEGELMMCSKPFKVKGFKG